MIHACQLYKRLQVSLVGLLYSLQKGIVYVCMRCSLEVNSRKHVSIENKRHRFELQGRAVMAPPLEWSKNSQPDKYYLNEEGSQQQKASEHRK